MIIIIIIISFTQIRLPSAAPRILDTFFSKSGNAF